ncbi:DUF4249 domain-containing protein [Bizionia myxarmorum]|uniref:DUF4249 domain-containing protein n=1 Tax=Bizionia myxarmorum TaxID=291186 RepID=A0A5D0RDP5_9FLAO|nr:DUF4249 domain-containing protein [Bizionia myxarmorum]TYB79632.1 DUF4249 domain-containing protein [Bizionia myxarmorum]
MKHIFFIILIALSFSSCEEVIDVDLPTTDPKLVIDASINWIKGTSGSAQEIKLSLTAPYFESTVPPANNADVFITDSNNINYNFVEDGTSGIYINTYFVPILNTQYKLTINYNNEIYTATETLLGVSEFDFIEQNLEGGITGEDTEIKAFFTDPVNEENYYLFEFTPSLPVTKTMSVLQDKFVNGNQIFGYYVEEDLIVNESVIIRNYGVSKRFYEFMFILLQQTASGGGPFETQPATVRGNCINTTNQANYPLGYFRLSEVVEITYTIE